MTRRGHALLEVRGLVKHFPVRKGLLGRVGGWVKAVDGVSFQIHSRESFGLVGESGCGKTTLGRLALKLEEPTSGEVLFEGKNILELPKGELRRLRREMQIIFQDPFSSLNPRMTVERILSEPLDIHGLHTDPVERRKRLAYLLEVVGLSQRHLCCHPHEFSGGQRQRIGIARALALNPKLIVADEPISALDVSIQAQILNLMKDLQKEFHLAYLFITHDFSVVRHLCNRVAVMYLGKIVEISEADSLFTHPQHPYTEALLSAIPLPDPQAQERRKRILLAGDVPSPLNPPAGCRFHPRCRYAEASCRREEPSLVGVEGRDGPGHWVACPVRPFRSRKSTAAIPEHARS